MIEKISDTRSSDLIEVRNIINDYMRMSLKMFQIWWKNTISVHRASVSDVIDSKLLILLQCQQWFDLFVLSSKTIKTIKSLNINIWSRTRKVNKLQTSNKENLWTKKSTLIHRIFILNRNQKRSNRTSRNSTNSKSSKSSKNLFN